MAGATLRTEIDDEAIHQALRRIRRVAESPAAALKDAGEYLQRAVDDRFRSETDPEGRPWEPLSEFTKANKRNDKILTERGGPGLRGSIHYRVDGDTLEQGTNKIYAAIHQFGGTITAKKGSLAIGDPKGAFAMVKSVRIPARPYLGISDEDQREIERILLRHAEPGRGKW